jgi:hypothetical protein
MLEVITDRAKEVPGAIQPPATNLTIASGTILGAVALFNSAFDKVFIAGASDDIRAAVLISVVAAWTIIFSADLFSRAIATSAAGRQRQVVPFPKGVLAKKTKGADQPGFLVCAVRGDGKGGSEFLLVKKGAPAEWVVESNVEFE